MSKSGFIAIIGRPNAGKSTLLNAILGTKLSIVTPKAQTTRERVLGILTEEQGQIVFIDTPGIHRAKEGGINAYMMSEAQEALEAPSVIWYLVDPFSGVKHENTVLELLEKAAQVPVFLIISKWDVVRKHKKEAIIERFAEEMKEAAQARGIRVEKVLQLSAPKKLHLKELLSDSWTLLSEGPLFYPDEEMISDRPVRFFVAEKIREQLLLQLGDELPYCCAVEIEQFKEANPPVEKLTRIEATIHVERDSQKGMVIGKGGQKIKEIGQAARQGIEDFVGGPVFLGLRVKVLKDWSKNAEALKRMGYDIAEKQKSARRH